MRYFEIMSGIRVAVSQEEQELIDKISKNKNLIHKSDLDEREQEVARILVSRGVLERTRDEKDAIVFVANSQDDIWRV